MKNEIINEAYDRLRDVYGQNPPARIINRFMSEKIMLSNQDTLLWMGFMGELFNKFREENIYFEMREAGIGASFIGWIMGVTNVNPLPPHDY